ncbi:MAG: tRNA uridine(34) 5-carboxymethylaminomethyl modification radical SAM/GNAT enzyme Elp3 [Candidatus Altiarchaeota archaeon]
MDELGKGYRRIIDSILAGQIAGRDGLDVAKRELSIRLGLDRFIRNSDILKAASPDERKRLLSILQKKPTRTISGVAVVAAMTCPSECPHGKCKYCPGGPQIDVPQSYTGKEPATRRAIAYQFNPYLQTTMRLYQLRVIGHPVDKAELIVMGGTLTAQMLDYQDWFVKECLRAMNEFEANYPLIRERGEGEFLKSYGSSPHPFHYTEDIQEANESAQVRCVGITFEPRPDWARRDEIDHMLGFGVTRVEIGVQNPDDGIYKAVERGHTVDDVVKATAELKDSGIKVGYHMMPGIMGHDPALDLGAFRKIFTDPRFKPDMVKIYPLLVMEGTEFSDRYRAGKFTPITTEQAVDVIARAKALMPKWVRTMRIMRDIPSNLVEAGIKSSNLGQLVQNELERRHIRCRCIRCREVGRFLQREVEPEPDEIRLMREDYDASGGKEVFLSFEDVKQDILLCFTRLRIPHAPFRPEITDKTALIRELHVYGPMLELGEKPEYEWQHRGYGAELIREAQRIAGEEFGMDRMCIISGIGVRDYYRRLGYRRDGPYMVSTLS